MMGITDCTPDFEIDERRDVKDHNPCIRNEHNLNVEMRVQDRTNGIVKQILLKGVETRGFY